MRVSISGSPTASSRRRLRSRTASMNCALLLGRDARRRLQIEDRLRAAQERHALVEGGQKAARPDGRPAARAARARLQHDERRAGSPTRCRCRR